MFHLQLHKDGIDDAVDAPLPDDCLTAENLFKALECICDIIDLDLQSYIIERNNKELLQ